MPASKAQRALTSERRAQLIRLRVAGKGFDEIAELLEYPTRGAATKDFKRALEQNLDEEGAAVATYRQLENERLDAELVRLNDMETKVRAVLDNRHIVVSNGRVILDPDTEEPMDDDAIVLQAVDRLVKIEDARRRNGERRAKLNGLDAPERTEVSGPDGGAVPLGSGTLNELTALIGIAGEQREASAEVSEAEDSGGDTDS